MFARRFNHNSRQRRTVITVLAWNDERVLYTYQTQATKREPSVTVTGCVSRAFFDREYIPVAQHPEFPTIFTDGRFYAKLEM